MTTNNNESHTMSNEIVRQNLDRGLTPGAGEAEPVRHEPAVVHEAPEPIDRREPVLGGEIGDLAAALLETNTIGSVAVARWAALVAGVPSVTITSTLRRTRSAASTGRRS